MYDGTNIQKKNYIQIFFTKKLTISGEVRPKFYVNCRQ